MVTVLEAIDQDTKLANTAADLVEAIRARIQASCPIPKLDGGTHKPGSLADGASAAIILRDEVGIINPDKVTPCAALALFEWEVVRVADRNFNELEDHIRGVQQTASDLGKCRHER